MNKFLTRHLTSLVLLTLIFSTFFYLYSISESNNPSSCQKSIEQFIEIRGSHNLHINQSFPSKNSHIIYITIAGSNPKYVDVATYLLKSIDHFLSRKDVDVLVICDAESHKLFDFQFSKNPHIRIFKIVVQSVNAYDLKLRPFEFENLYLYSKVIYLDLDILIISHDIDKLFDESFQKGILHVKPETTLGEANMIYWSTVGFTNNQLDLFLKLGITPFNTGSFGFLFSKEMFVHFRSVLNIIEKTGGAFYTEQSYMNQYFNSLLMTEGQILDRYVQLNVENAIPQPQHPICHFYGANGEADLKLRRMKHYIETSLTFLL